MLPVVWHHRRYSATHPSSPLTIVCDHTPKLIRELIVELRRNDTPVIEHSHGTLLSMVCDGELVNLSQERRRVMPVVVIVEPLTMHAEDVVALRILAYCQNLFPGRVATVVMIQRGHHISVAKLMKPWVNSMVVPLDLVSLTPIVTMTADQLPELERTASDISLPVLYVGKFPGVHPDVRVTGYGRTTKLLQAKTIVCPLHLLHQTAVSKRKYVVVCESMTHLQEWSTLSSYSAADNIIVLSPVPWLHTELPLPTPQKLWAMACDKLGICTQTIVQGDYNKPDPYQQLHFNNAINSYGRWQSVRGSYLYYSCTHQHIEDYQQSSKRPSLLCKVPRYLQLTVKMMVVAVMVEMDSCGVDPSTVTEWRETCRNKFNHGYSSRFMECYGEPVLSLGWLTEALQLDDSLWHRTAFQMYQQFAQTLRSLC